MSTTMQVTIDVREKDRIKSATQYYEEQGLEVSDFLEFIRILIERIVKPLQSD